MGYGLPKSGLDSIVELMVFGSAGVRPNLPAKIIPILRSLDTKFPEICRLKTPERHVYLNLFLLGQGSLRQREPCLRGLEACGPG